MAKTPITSGKTVHSKAPLTGKGHVVKVPHAVPGAVDSSVPTRPRLGPGPAEPPAGAKNYSSEQQQQ